MRRLAVFLASLLALLAAPALADVFTVSGVEVDATADSAANARDLALAQGQREAANRLVARLTLPEDAAFAPEIGQTLATQLVSGFEVEEEKVSGTRYLGVVNVSFDAERVRTWLNGAGVPFVEARTRAVVVAPLWRDGETRLWRDNPWLDAWTEARLEGELVPIIAPTGDLGDIAALSPGAARARNLAALQELAARYGSERVLIAEAQPTSSGAYASLSEADFARGGSIVNLGPVAAGELADLVTRASDVLQGRWKRLAIVRDAATADLVVTARFNGLAEWRRLQSAVGGSSLVTDARLDAVVRDGALLALTHRGTRDQLAAVLAERGVSLVQGREGAVVHVTGATVAADAGPAPGEENFGEEHGGSFEEPDDAPTW